MTRFSIIVGACLIAGVPTLSLAQAPPTPTTPQPSTTPPSPDRAANCTPTRAAPNEGTVKSGATSGQSSEPLGDKLAKSDGVLCPPPGVDPEMHAPTPNTGTMPVIPPPGTPGGDQTIRPK